MKGHGLASCHHFYYMGVMRGFFLGPSSPIKLTLFMNSPKGWSNGNFVLIARMIFAENDHCGTVGQLFRTYLCQDKLHLCIKSPPGLLASVVLQLRHSEVTRIIYESRVTMYLKGFRLRTKVQIRDD